MIFCKVYISSNKISFSAVLRAVRFLCFLLVGLSIINFSFYNWSILKHLWRRIYWYRFRYSIENSDNIRWKFVSRLSYCGCVVKIIYSFFWKQYCFCHRLSNKYWKKLGARVCVGGREKDRVRWKRGGEKSERV